MTEGEWLTCEDPENMLRFIKQRRTMRRQVKQRKQRLFSVACCRRIWPLIDNERSRQGIEVVERFADDQATSEELQAAETEANAIWLKNAADDITFACLKLFEREINGFHVSTCTLSAVFKQQQLKANKPFDLLDSRKVGACPSEERQQCELIRDIFGNPFRQSMLAPISHILPITALAPAAYNERFLPSGHLDNARLAVLSDALEEAGCDDTAILSHLRSPGPHVRGCWALDLILGKA